MRPTHSVLAASLLALVLVSPASVRAQQSSAPAAAPGKAASARNHAGYFSNESDFIVGRRVHLRSTKSFIGTIRAVHESHSFPPDRFPRAKMKAVQIERRDGPRWWVPVEGITRIYVVR